MGDLGIFGNFSEIFDFLESLFFNFQSAESPGSSLKLSPCGFQLPPRMLESHRDWWQKPHNQINYRRNDKHLPNPNQSKIRELCVPQWGVFSVSASQFSIRVNRALNVQFYYAHMIIKACVKGRLKIWSWLQAHDSIHSNVEIIFLFAKPLYCFLQSSDIL